LYNGRLVVSRKEQKDAKIKQLWNTDIPWDEAEECTCVIEGVPVIFY